MREIVGLPLLTEDSTGATGSASTDHFSKSTAAATTAANADGITAVLNDGVLLVNNPASVSQVVYMMHTVYCIFQCLTVVYLC
jgi:hypothetical protein